MSDILFDKLFTEGKRWEQAIRKGKDKDMNRGSLSAMCNPEVRVLIAERFLTGTYEICPPHMQLIPKDKPGEFRTVYINEDVDRVLLSMINDLLMELCPDMIHPSCKSYQKGTGCGKVVREVTENMSRFKVGWKSDLSKYFDSVPLRAIDDLLDKVEAKCGSSCVLDVVRKYYHQDLCFDTNGNLTRHYQSLKQGCAVAAFFADALLYEMDAKLSAMARRSGGFYCRYSDDCLYIGRDAAQAMEVMKGELAKFQLTLNPKKVEWLSPDRWFKFLGFMIKGSEITLSGRRVKNFQKEIEKLTLKGQKPGEARRGVVRYLYSGEYSWASAVLPFITNERDLETMNSFVLDCLRASITGKTKVGGLGTVVEGSYTILRGKGQNVKANRAKTPGVIEGYLSLGAARKAMLTNWQAYETLVRSL